MLLVIRFCFPLKNIEKFITKAGMSEIFGKWK